MVDRNEIIEKMKIIRTWAACSAVTLNDMGKLVDTIDGALELLMDRDTRVLSVADIVDEGMTPDVIWIERRDDSDVIPGVWQIDHYEMAEGSIVRDLGEEIAEAPESYGQVWRCWWPEKPTEEQRRTAKWNDL